MSKSELARFLDEARAEVDAALERLLGERPDDASGGDPGRVREAMRYAVLGGGKRLRPALALAAAEAVAGAAGEAARATARAAALPAACAVELLHAYTLVHDDLPAMDDDVERRGKPTVHVAFGEAVAILVGDALQAAAFGALAPLGARAADAVAVLAERTGARGLIAGQCRDIALELASGGTAPTLAELERVHLEKTGMLFSAAVELGAIAAGADVEARRRLASFGLAFGVAFQHADDLADGDQPTYADAARRRLHELAAECLALLAPFGPTARPLVLMTKWVEDGSS